MNQETVQEFATTHDLDVRPLEKWHWRLLDEYGKFVIDIFFKKDKKTGRILRNTVHIWKNDSWVLARDLNHLENIIKNCI